MIIGVVINLSVIIDIEVTVKHFVNFLMEIVSVKVIAQGIIVRSGWRNVHIFSLKLKRFHRGIRQVDWRLGRSTTLLGLRLSSVRIFHVRSLELLNTSFSHLMVESLSALFIVSSTSSSEGLAFLHKLTARTTPSVSKGLEVRVKYLETPRVDVFRLGRCWLGVIVRLRVLLNDILISRLEIEGRG